MTIDRELLENQIRTINYLLDYDLMEHEREAIEGILNMLGDIAGIKGDLLTIELV